jgi:hypothetical protein
MIHENMCLSLHFPQFLFYGVVSINDIQGNIRIMYGKDWEGSGHGPVEIISRHFCESTEKNYEKPHKL